MNRICIKGFIVAAMAFIPLSASPDTSCQIVISGDVLQLDGLVQHVSERTVGIAPEVTYAAPDITAATSTHATPAIVFIIDDSGSMMQNDKDANRYKVTGEILDEIYADAPGTRVAVVTFRNWLAWDWRENPIFRKISDPFSWNDSYFPLAPLDSVYADGKRTIDKIKDLFTLDQWNLLQSFHSDSTERTRPQEFDNQGNPIPMSRNQQGTDITLAFMAAKDALRATSTPVERQFIVFLSDGLHGAVDVEMEGTKTDYIQGEGVPATYTVFLGDSVKTPPEQLQTMVSNIQNNGYSSSNPKSQLWSIASNHDTLLTLMQREILSEVYAPLRMASGATAGSAVTSRITESDLIFSHPFPLEPDTTIISFDLSFKLTDAKGEIRGDTVISSMLTFIRDTGAASEVLDPGLSSVCYARDMALFSGTNPISTAIKNAQTSVTARFTLEGIDPSSSQIMTVANDAATDSAVAGLNWSPDYFSGTINRVQDDTPDPADAIVQHRLGGSLRFIWRNPYLPLDTFSRVYPVTPYDPVVITGVSYRDSDHDGRIDGVVVTTGEAINSKEFDALTADRLGLPAERMLTIESITPLAESRGFLITVSQHDDAPVTTGISSSDSLVITDFVIGPYDDYIEAGTYAIADEMAPVLISVTYTRQDEGDSLLVTFSEPVRTIDSDMPFKFISTDGTAYRMVLDESSSAGNEVKFSVERINPESVVPGMNDSVWIAADARISDVAGNIQVEPNRKVQLKQSGAIINFTVIAGPNPIIRNRRGSIRVKDWGTLESGTLIIVTPDFPVMDIKQVVDEVEVRIYDAVGNLIAYNPTNRAIGKKWYINWDGTNRNNRVVGNGVYLAVIDFDVTVDSTELSIQKRVKLAVK